MNVLFLSLLDFNSLEESNIYTDLLRQFRKNGHNIYAVSPTERRKKQKTRVINEQNAKILKLRTGNIQKTNVIEKGVSTLLIEPQIVASIKKYFKGVNFDLVLYSTPPITFCNAIKFIKKRDNAKSYLLLKDIFPQNAVDIGLLSKTGIKGLIYKYFREKEKKLYRISDRIGCMSQANVDYVLEHNKEVCKDKVEVCPNCIEVKDINITEEERKRIRKKYSLPQDKKIFVYGGNLGKPQGVPFIIECLKSQENNEDVFFLIIGDGTEFGLINTYISEEKPKNIKLLKTLPKEEYDLLITACDVGMIFLDYRFTIPNFPSRLLSYMQVGLPVLACTDKNTDIGNVIAEGKFGWWCESCEVENFKVCVNKVYDSNLSEYGHRARKFLGQQYTVSSAYKTISNSFREYEL